MGVTAPECVICAWRATCNLKFIYEGSSSLHCPEFTRDVSIDGDVETVPPQNNTPSIEKKESKKERKPDLTAKSQRTQRKLFFFFF